MKKTGKDHQCTVCKKSFYVPKWREKTGAKYCSYKCYWENKHDIPWNKGLVGVSKANAGSFVKSGLTWNGDSFSYKSLHYWVGKTLGKPNICSDCEKEVNGKKIHWANISGQYKKDPTDWKRLCVKCHYKFDNQNERRQKYL